MLDEPINVIASCKVHRAVYDKLSEVLEELRRLDTGDDIENELMDNIALIARLVDELYIAGKTLKRTR